MLYSTRCWQKLFLTAHKSPEFVINPRDLPPAKTTGTQLSQLEPGKGGKGGALFNSKKRDLGEKKWDESINFKKQVHQMMEKMMERVRLCVFATWRLFDFC